MFSKRILAFGLVVALLLMAGPPATSGQGETVSSVDLAVYENNPIMTVGAEGAWDELGVAEPRVIYQDGLFHMFYLGWHTQPPTSEQRAVGYATSQDGVTWTTYADNPIFVPDDSISPWGIHSEITTFVDGTWMMLFTPCLAFSSRSAPEIRRATAQAPAGPWVVDPEPVFVPGSAREWDYGDLVIESVLKMDDRYELYYSALPLENGWVGRATSTDTTLWTKYDDPVTTAFRWANSDPVFQKGDWGSWDAGFLCCPIIVVGEHGWEMFYTGADTSARLQFRTGFATSEDGISWTRFGNSPVLEVPDSAMIVSSVVVVGGTYYLYYTYQISDTSFGIGVATGTVTWE